MMANFIIFFSFIALLHFLYEGILLPLVHMRLRNKFFKLRDELRRERIDNPKECKLEVFSYLDDGIGRFINNLPHLTPSAQARAYSELGSNKELRKATEKRLDMIQSSESEQAKKIFREVNSAVEMALIANVGIWFIYLVPIALLCLCFSRLAQLAKDLVAMPPKSADQVLQHAY
ncbi:hypothetical protein PDESU_06183 [Pontiella desulfatans]|uniref:Uncharacterized protein n=1 Tax=Pontiella desulfatans TaxID=2750659 RepID=A0A6C2UC01_PONDE|nr:hypothetical protein [Pontiella desulfatans]VGO17585.1 hypothetical protein PDESU_06183 [Pontiella desulfatans]